MDGNFCSGIGTLIVSLFLLYLGGVACMWVWAPWWAALALSVPAILLALGFLLDVVMTRGR